MKQLAPALVALAVLLLGCRAPGSAPVTTAPATDATVQSLERQVEELTASASTIAPTQAATSTPHSAAPTPTCAAASPTAPSVMPTAAPTAPPSAAPTPTSIPLQQAVINVQQYTVFIWTNAAAGSGISLGDGKVLTNFHVINGASQVSLRFADGREEPVAVARVDARRDLALLQSGVRDSPAASFRDARSLQPSEGLIVVGYPRPDVLGASESTVTRGSVSARRQVNG